MNKILLIDIENCGHALHQLEEKLQTYTQIYVVYATSNVNLSLDGLYLLIPFIQNQRFHLVKMPTVGKDAADFGLAFIAGQLSQQYQPIDTSFEIISNDHAMDYVAELLQRQNFEVEVKKKAVQTSDILEKLVSTLAKVNNKPTSEEAFLNSIMSWTKVDRTQANLLLKQVLQLGVLTADEKEKIVPQVKPHLVFLQQYCQYLFNQNNRPATQKTLLNSIKTVMNIEKETTLIDRYNLLVKHKIVIQNEQNNKVQYNLEEIKKYL